MYSSLMQDRLHNSMRSQNILRGSRSPFLRFATRVRHIYCGRLQAALGTMDPSPHTPAPSPPTGTDLGQASCTPQVAPASNVSTDSGFHWKRAWWPVLPLEMLPRDRPHPVPILGLDLVVWWSRSGGSSAGSVMAKQASDHVTVGGGAGARGLSSPSVPDREGSWVVMRDRCPHRLSPLSMGRLSADGASIVCSYHGWAFESGGSCTAIPQIEGVGAPLVGTLSPPLQQQQQQQGSIALKLAEGIKASKRACVESFPIAVADGVLFVWLDGSPEV